MPWQNPAWYGFNKGTVNARAPNASGVYGLKDSDGQWLYVGEATAIASSLLRHLAGDNWCITEGHPATFSFEALAVAGRAARRDALTLELLPHCNRRPG
jgi:hypothetical protein